MVRTPKTYSNPYYTEPLVVGNTTISYSEPLAAAPPAVTADAGKASSELPPGVTADGMKHFDAARATFYASPVSEPPAAATNKALASMPNDAVLHEFRALSLFALGKYHDAATTLHPVLAVGPGWDWTTMSSLYPRQNTYGNCRALEAAVSRAPSGRPAVRAGLPLP